MYKIQSNSATFKLTDEEKEILNDVAVNLQTIENRQFTNSKQIVFALVNRCKLLETELETLKTESLQNENSVNETENNLETESLQDENISEIGEIKQQLIDAIGFPETPSDTQLYDACLQIINSSNSFIETIAIKLNMADCDSVEIMQALHEKLTQPENTVQVEFNPEQLRLLRTIIRFRAQQKIDVPGLTLQELIRSMIFNRGCLFNEHGEFETGIRAGKMKK